MKVYTLQEVADELKMKWGWVDRKVRAGKIKSIKMGGTRRVTEDELNILKKEGVK